MRKIKDVSWHYTIDFCAGTDIQDAAYTAWCMALEKDKKVTFDFNGKKMFAYRDMSPEDIENLYHARTDSQSDKKATTTAKD